MGESPAMRMSSLDPRSAFRRAAPVLGRLFAATSLAAFLVTSGVACGPPPAPVKKPENTEETAEKAKIEKANDLIAKANSAYNAKDFDLARKLLGEARDLNVESLLTALHHVGALLEQIDAVVATG